MCGIHGPEFLEQLEGIGPCSVAIAIDDVQLSLLGKNPEVRVFDAGGQFVEAPHAGDVVKVSSLASRADYVGAVRISG